MKPKNKKFYFHYLQTKNNIKQLIKQKKVILFQFKDHQEQEISHYISEGKKVIVTSEKAKALEVLREKLPEEIRSLSLALLTDKGVDKDLEYSIEIVLKHQEDDNELKKTQSNINSLEEKLSLIQQDKNIVINKIITLMSRDIT